MYIIEYDTNRYLDFTRIHLMLQVIIYVLRTNKVDILHYVNYRKDYLTYCA